MKKGFGVRFRSDLLAGGLVLAPLGITAWVFFLLVSFADGLILLLPEALRPETYLGFAIPGLGVLLAIIAKSTLLLSSRFSACRK